MSNKNTYFINLVFIYHHHYIIFISYIIFTILLYVILDDCHSKFSKLKELYLDLNVKHLMANFAMKHFIILIKAKTRSYISNKFWCGAVVDQNRNRSWVQIFFDPTSPRISYVRWFHTKLYRNLKEIYHRYLTFF